MQKIASGRYIMLEAESISVGTKGADAVKGVMSQRNKTW